MVSNERLSLESKQVFTGREGRKKKLHKGDVIRIVHIALMSHAAQVKKKRKEEARC